MLTKAELHELTDRVRSRTGRAEDARRARVILLLAEGLTWDDVCERAECSRGFVALWARRFRAERLAGLYSRHRGQKPFGCTPSVEAKILNATRKPPTDGSTHWSTRRLAAKLGVSHMMVARVWSKHRLQPHRLERYMSSNDPNFEEKASRNHRAVPETRLRTRRCSAWTRRRRFKRSIATIRCCRCRRDGPNGMGSSITGTARWRCTRRPIRRPAKCSARPRRGTPRSSS